MRQKMADRYQLDFNTHSLAGVYGMDAATKTIVNFNTHSLAGVYVSDLVSVHQSDFNTHSLAGVYGAFSLSSPAVSFQYSLPCGSVCVALWRSEMFNISILTPLRECMYSIVTNQNFLFQYSLPCGSV